MYRNIKNINKYNIKIIFIFRLYLYNRRILLTIILYIRRNIPYILKKIYYLYLNLYNYLYLLNIDNIY